MDRPIAAARRFLALFEREPVDVARDLAELAAVLDELGGARWECTPPGVYLEADFDDDLDEHEALEPEDCELRKRAVARYPGFDYYAVAFQERLDDPLCGIVLGDAIDDLADIQAELIRVTHLHERMGNANACAYYAWSFDAHWGAHLRDLQSFVHRCMTRWRDSLI